MLNAKELIKEINSQTVEYGHLAFWWLGQFSFAVKTQSKTIFLDPFLSEHPRRLLPPLLKPEDLAAADLITGSHNHDDHIDQDALPAIMNAGSQNILIVPKAAWRELRGLGLPSERIHPLDDAQTYENDGLKITAVKAAHEFFDRDKELGYPYLGFVIETDGVVIYHSGDTCIYEGMVSRLKQWRFTVAFLPINGRDAVRLKAGCIGNMTYQEAVDLAGKIRPQLTVPGHFGMFADNTENPRLFADYMDVKYPDLRYCIPEYGKMVFM